MSKYQNFVPQPIAFYRELYSGDRQYQNYRLNQCKSDLSTWRLVVVAQGPGLFPDSPRLRVPTFQIKRDIALGDAVTDFKLVNIEGIILDTDLALTGFSIADLNSTPTLDSIIYDGSILTPDISGLPYGHYYLTVTDGTNTWYSEVFELEGESTIDPTFPASCGTLGNARLEWSNPQCIISETIYNDAPSFQLILPVDLGQPDYKYKPDTQDDGQGGVVNLFQRIDKRWRFFIVAPEYIADALTSVQMMSSVSLNFESGDFIICRDVEVEVDWTTPCFAKISFTFSADFLSKTACCV